MVNIKIAEQPVTSNTHLHTNIKNWEHFFGSSSNSDDLSKICPADALWIFAPKQFYNFVYQEMRFENVLWQKPWKRLWHIILDFAYFCSFKFGFVSCDVMPWKMRQNLNVFRQTRNWQEIGIPYRIQRYFPNFYWL